MLFQLALGTTMLATSTLAPLLSLHAGRSCDPLDLQQLPFAGDLWFVLVNPRFEAPTAEMRAVLPKEIPMKQVGAGQGCLGARRGRGGLGGGVG